MEKFNLKKDDYVIYYNEKLKKSKSTRIENIDEDIISLTDRNKCNIDKIQCITRNGIKIYNEEFKKD